MPQEEVVSSRRESASLASDKSSREKGHSDSPEPADSVSINLTNFLDLSTAVDLSRSF